MAQYSIKDLEKLSGIKAHTIRIWEKRYDLIQPQRTQTNIRIYCENDLKKIINVSVLIRNGFRISSIASMTSEEVFEKTSVFTYSSLMSGDTIEGLTLSMLEFNEFKFEKIFNKSVMQLGLERALIEVIIPFLKKVRSMWQTDVISSTHENFVLNLIRQKLFVSLDGQVIQRVQKIHTFCLFRSEITLPDLSLLIFAYLLKKRGHRVIFLGEEQSIEDLKKSSLLDQSDSLVTTYNSKVNSDFQHFAHSFEKWFPNKKIYLFNFMQVHPDSDVETGTGNQILPITSIEDFIREIDNLT